MFDTPVDAWYTWLGLSIASVALLGVGATLPTAQPPAAAAAAQTVDRTASTTYDATAEHPLDARAVRIGPAQLGLRNEAGTAHATYAFGPVTPVHSNDRLDAVLRGAPPESRFDDATAFCRVAATERDRTPRWRETGGTLVVRHVDWGGCDVTLVGA